MTHVHPETTVHWNRSRMQRHLADEHNLSAPMAWDDGQLHQIHLNLHQQPTPTPEAEEAAMPDDPNQSIPTVPTLAEQSPLLPVPVRQVLSSLTDHMEHAAGELWQLVRDNEALREQLAKLHDRADELQDERDVANTNLQQQIRDLHEVTEQNRSLRERRDEALERLGEVAGERDRALEAGRVLEAQRDDARRDLKNLTAHLHAVTTESDAAKDDRDDAHQDIEAASRDLDDMTRERDQFAAQLAECEAQSQRVQRILAQRNRVILTGGATLRKIVADLRSQGPYGEVIAHNVADDIEEILMVTPSPEPVAAASTEPNLGLATTGEMLDEIRTRIDLGHCGLGYRTVDGDF